MAVLHTPNLNLPYPDGNDLLRDGDNRIHDLAAALDVLPIGVPGPAGPAGPAGSAGPAGPAGPSGQSAGKIFYFAPSDPSDIAGYKTMLPSPSTGAEQTIATPCTGTNVDVLIAVFATDPGVPGAVDYPAGSAFRRIYANVQAGGARLHVQVYKRDAAGTETLIRDEFSDVFVNQTVALQEWMATGSAAGAILATDRLVCKLYGQRTTGPTTVTVTTYYEGSAHTSQAQTTISAGAQGPAGPPGSLYNSYKGAWTSAMTYAAGDIVTDAGSTWMANQAVAPSAGSFADNFNRANGAPGSPWTNFTGSTTPAINSNRLLIMGGTPKQGCFIDAVATDGTLTVSFAVNAATGSNAVIILRASTADLTTATYLQLNAITGDMYYWLGGAFQNQVAGSGGWAFGSAGTIKAVLAGSSVAVYLNSVLKYTVTVAALTGSRVGLAQVATSGEGGTWDDFAWVAGGAFPTAKFDLLAAKGAGIPAGGSTGQVLKKLSAADYDVGWVT